MNKTPRGGFQGSLGAFLMLNWSWNGESNPGPRHYE